MTDTLRLSDLTTVIARGISPKYTDVDGVIVLNQRCIRDQTISYENHRRNDLELRNVSSQKSLKPLDILVNSTGVGTLGRVAQITSLAEPKMTVDSHVTIVRPDPERISPRFLGFVVRGNQKVIEAMAEGATGQTELSRTRLGELPIYVPPLPTQQKIASILSAYDDLIENNNRRIQILEEMAQRIYREWFVHFRFPGHENVKMVDSELGKIPEGWKVRKLGDVTRNFDSQRVPLSSLIRANARGLYPYYGAAKVLDFVEDYLFEGEHLLFAEDGTVQTREGYPVLQLVDDRFWANNHTHVLQAKDPLSTKFLYLQLLSIRITPYITGSAQPKITQTNLNRIPILIPDQVTLGKIEQHIHAIFSLINRLNVRNASLRRTRDLLLPRLISGKLDVEDLDIAV